MPAHTSISSSFSQRCSEWSERQSPTSASDGLELCTCTNPSHPQRTMCAFATPSWRKQSPSGHNTKPTPACHLPSPHKWNHRLLPLAAPGILSYRQPRKHRPTFTDREQCPLRSMNSEYQMPGARHPGPCDSISE